MLDAYTEKYVLQEGKSSAHKKKIKTDHRFKFGELWWMSITSRVGGGHQAQLFRGAAGRKVGEPPRFRR